MRRFKFALTISFLVFGLSIGFFIKGRLYMYPEMYVYYGISSPFGCIRRPLSDWIINSFYLSYAGVAIFGTMLISSILKYSFNIRPRFTNYKCDSFINSDHFFTK